MANTTIKMVPAVNTNNELINAAKQHGFEVVTKNNGKAYTVYMTCPACRAAAHRVMPEVDVDKLPWTNFKVAIKFNNPSKGVMVACRCGYREFRPMKFTHKCPNEGCNVTLSNPGDRCYRCNPPTEEEKANFKAQKIAEAESRSAAEATKEVPPENPGYEPRKPIKMTNVCATCGKPLPPDRTKWCYKCRKPGANTSEPKKELHI